MKKARIISMALTVLMMVSVFAAVPASASATTWGEDFEAKTGEWTTVNNAGNYTLSYVDGFTSKAGADTVYRIYRAGKATGDKTVTLEKTFENPVSIPENGVFRFSMEIARQEYASELNVYLIGKNASGNSVTSPYVIRGTNCRFYLNGKQTIAPHSVGNWFKFDVEQNYDGTNKAYVNGKEYTGTTASAAFTEITGIKITVESKEAPTNQTPFVKGDTLPVDILIDNINIETAASAAELSAKAFPQYLNSLNMTFDQINYNFGGDESMRPYNSTDGNNHGYVYGNAAVVNATSYGSRNADGLVRASYMTEAGVYGKASNDSAFKFFTDAGTFSGATSVHMNIKEAGTEINGTTATLKSGDVAVLSFSIAYDGKAKPWINLFGDANSGAHFIGGKSLFKLDGNNNILIFEENTNVPLIAGEWNKLDFVITMGDTNCTIQPYLNGKKLVDKTFTGTYAAGICPSILNLRMAANISATAGKNAAAQALYYDDFSCSFYAKGSTIPNFETAIDADKEFATVIGSKIYLENENVTVAALNAGLATDGRGLRVLRGGAEVKEGNVANGDYVEAITEFGGEIYYTIALPQKNAIQENTFDKVGYDNAVEKNKAIPGWDLNKVGGSYSWQSTYLASEGIGGKAEDDNYFVFDAKGLTKDMIDALGSGSHNDAHMNTYHTVEYPKYTYEFSIYADPDKYGQAEVSVFYSSSGAVTAFIYHSNPNDRDFCIRNSTGVKSQEVIVDNVVPGRWYKIAITVDKDGMADYYINGDLVKAGYDMLPNETMSSIRRFKMGGYSTIGTAEKPLDSWLAFDNIRWYGAEYADYNGGDIIEVSASDAITLDKAKSKIYINGSAMSMASFVNALDTDADIAIYTDNSLAKECTAVVTAGSVLTLTSANGEVIKYFDIVDKATLPTEFGEINTSTENGTATATVSFTSYKAQDAALVIATYNGNKLVSVDVDEAVDSVGDKTLTASVAVAAGETVKTFFFDGLATLKPIK